MEQMKAIKTLYDDYEFNTRLEARWAVLLDTFHWNWEYEKFGDMPSRFILHGTRIVPFPKNPDLDILNQDVFILVNEDINKYSSLTVKIMADCGRNVLTVGPIPDGNSDREILDNLKKMTKGEYFCDGSLHFYCRLYGFLSSDMTWPDSTHCHVLWVDDDDKPVISAWHARTGRKDGNISKTLEAYKQARQARFEYGQSGYEI